MIGDSYVVGQTTDMAVGATLDGLATGVSRYSGWDVYSMGQGGTGYLKTQAFVNVYGHSSRMNALALLPTLDAIYIGGVANDILGGFTPAATATAAIAMWDAVAAARPGTPIIVAGPQPFNATAAGLVAMNTAIKAAALAHPAVRGYIDWTVPTNWITGTGNNAAKNGTGNADLFLCSDGVHPSLDGYDYLVRRTVAEIAKIKA